MWTGSVEGNTLVMTYLSKSGEENYPGDLKVKVTFQVTEANELRLDYVATTTEATPVNLTSHPFINLAKHVSCAEWYSCPPFIKLKEKKK